jgi:hypothetical protein
MECLSFLKIEIINTFLKIGKRQNLNASWPAPRALVNFDKGYRKSSDLKADRK